MPEGLALEFLLQLLPTCPYGGCEANAVGGNFLVSSVEVFSTTGYIGHFLVSLHVKILEILNFRLGFPASLKVFISSIQTCVQFFQAKTWTMTRTQRRKSGTIYFRKLPQIFRAPTR